MILTGESLQMAAKHQHQCLPAMLCELLLLPGIGQQGEIRGVLPGFEARHWASSLFSLPSPPARVGTGAI